MSISCRQKGTGSLTLKYFESSTLTLGGNKNGNKIRALTSKNSTKDGKNDWEDSEFWKLSFKFFHRQFDASNLTAPLSAAIEGLTSATEDW
jgi:hypothetical protein